MKIFKNIFLKNTFLGNKKTWEIFKKTIPGKYKEMSLTNHKNIFMGNIKTYPWQKKN